MALEQLTLHRAVLQLLDEGQTLDKADNIVETVQRFLVRLVHTAPMTYLPDNTLCVGLG